MWDFMATQLMVPFIPESMKNEKNTLHFESVFQYQNVAVDYDVYYPQYHKSEHCKKWSKDWKIISFFWPK